MKGIKPVIVLIGIAIGLVFTNSVLFAQEGARGLTISPLTFELTANPGDSLENKIKVANPTDSSISIKMEVEDFTAMGETGQVKVEEMENETYSLKKWVKTNPVEFTLEPKEQKFVTFAIDVPKNAEPGGKYGSVLATITGAVRPEETGVAIAQKVGALVLLSVSGEIKEEVNVKEFSAPGFSEYGPVPFTVRFENTGTIHERPRGFVTITNIFGKEVANVEFPQQNVIPGAIRKIEAKWNKNWLWGLKYQATLVGSYGSQNSTLSAVTTFWAFPWKIGLGVLIALILIIYLIVRTRRKIKKAEEILKKNKEK
jgi:cytochrome bd-type quinol oxidase subunit 1